MTVLVAVASRHGATEEMAEAIGKQIHASGFAVDVVKLPDSGEYGPRPDLAKYDAVVLGSGVYLGRWLAPAREFVAANEDALKVLPVWAFSSGPIGAHGTDDDGHAGAALLTAINPVDHRIFGGKLDPSHLGLGEHVLVTLIRAGEEDNRDWAEIFHWADEISHALQTTTGRSG